MAWSAALAALAEAGSDDKMFKGRLDWNSGWGLATHKSTAAMNFEVVFDSLSLPHVSFARSAAEK